jgi:hypothetical protein
MYRLALTEQYEGLKNIFSPRVLDGFQKKYQIIKGDKMFIIDPWVGIGSTVADMVGGSTFRVHVQEGFGEFWLGDEVEFMCNANKWQIRDKPSVKWLSGDYENIDKYSEFIAKEIWKSYWERHFTEDPNSKTTITTCPMLPRYYHGAKIEDCNCVRCSYL